MSDRARNHSIDVSYRGGTRWILGCCWLLLYGTILRSRVDSHVILHEWMAFYRAFLNIHRSSVLTALAWLVAHETAAVSARAVYIIEPCTMSLNANHIRKVRACLAVTCHLLAELPGSFTCYCCKRPNRLNWWLDWNGTPWIVGMRSWSWAILGLDSLECR